MNYVCLFFNEIMESINKKIKLNLVSKNDIRFLYCMLKIRDPISRISHKKMPTFEQHKKFVLSKPYKFWYIIKFENKKIGSIYLSKQDEIGIFLKNEFQNKGISQYVLLTFIKIHPRPRFLANVSPKNKISQKFFQKHGFIHIQQTYELINEQKI